MYNHPDDATLFVDKFMTRSVSKQLVYRKIRIMLSHPSTNKKQLSEKLLGIARYFAGDNDRILQSINNLFLKFLNRWLSGSNSIETFQGTSDEFIEIVQSLTDAHLQPDCNIRREMEKNGDRRLHGVEITPHSRKKTRANPFFAWGEKYVYFMTNMWSYGNSWDSEYIFRYELNSLPIRPRTGAYPRILFYIESNIESGSTTDEVEILQGTSDEFIEIVQSLMDAYPQPSAEVYGEFRHNIRREMEKNGNRKLHGVELAHHNMTQQKINTGVTPFWAWSYTHIYFMTHIHYGIYSDNILEYSLKSIPRHPRTGTFPSILESYTVP